MIIVAQAVSEKNLEISKSFYSNLWFKKWKWFMLASSFMAWGRFIYEEVSERSSEQSQCILFWKSKDNGAVSRKRAEGSQTIL